MISYAIKDDKKKIIISAFITIICVIIAASHSLNVAAQEVDAPLADVGAVAVGMVAGAFASYAVTSWAAAAAAGATAVVLGGVAIPTAIVIVVLGVLVATGVTLTVTAIIHALNDYFELHRSDCELFIDNLVNGFKNGLIDIRHKISMQPTLFNYVYDWLKSNIISAFNDIQSNVDFGNAVDGFEVYQPDYVFNHVPSMSEIYSYYTNNHEYDLIEVRQADFNGSTDKTFTATDYIYTNDNTNVNITFGGNCNMRASGWYCVGTIKEDFILNSDLTVSAVYEASHADTSFFTNANYWSKFHFCEPYVYQNNNKTYLRFYTVWESNVGNRDTTSPTIRINNVDVTTDVYYNRTILDGSGNTYKIKLSDGTVISNFDGMYEFLYYLFCKDCKLVIENQSNTSEVSNSTANYTTVNNYYNTKRDVLKKLNDTVAGKVHDGSITDQSEGTIDIGFTDVLNTTMSNELADTLPLTDVSGISEVSTTDIVTDGTTVMEGSSVVSVAASLIIAGNHIRSGLGTITLKFPFDVIPNVKNFLNKLVREGEPLVIDYNIVAPHIGTFPVHIDFNKYSTIITVFRWVVLVSLAIGLLIASKHALQFI